MSDDHDTDGGTIDAEAVLTELRDPAVTARIVAVLAARHPVRFQASLDSPGLIERIGADGSRTVGQWLDGRFVTADE